MTSYRFRVKLEEDPTSLWRDIVIGKQRTLVEFQVTINGSVGLNQDHLWFFGSDRDYWGSEIQYQRPEEYERSDPGFAIGWDGQVCNARETSIADLVEELGLDERDRLCYLFDYGDEWRFYAILKEINMDDPADTEPEVVNQQGDPAEQCARWDERW